MRIVNQATISTKIFGGYGITLILFIVIAVIGVLEFDEARDSFVEYRSLARQSNQLGRIQANLLEARLHVKTFIINQSEESISGVKERASRALEFIQAGEELARGSVYLNRNGLAGDITKTLMLQGKQIKGYLEGFDHVLQQQAKRNRIVHQELDIVGLELEGALSRILGLARESKDAEFVYWAGEALRRLFLMRLYTGKFLIQNDPSSFDRALSESDDLSENLERLRVFNRDSASTNILTVTHDRLGIYRDAIRSVGTAIETRNKIIRDDLGVIGPSVAGAVEQIKLSLLREQNLLGPSAEDTLADAKTIIIFVYLAIFVLSVLAAFVIGRSISLPIISMTTAFNALADGNKSAEIPCLDHADEIGEMAKAAQIFKEKTIEAETLAMEVASRTNQLEEKSQELHATNIALQEELERRQKIERQLVHAQKLESLGILAGGIAHDFNNMLLVIVTGAQSALRRLKSGTGDPAPPVERIQAAANRSQAVVNQILGFSRQESLEEMEVFDFGNITHEALTLLRAGVLSSVELNANIEKDELLVRGDISRIQQVIINLVNNAYFACRENGGRISLETTRFDLSREKAEDYYSLSEGSYVRLSVIDSGSGIPEENLSKIFDPFFTTKPVGEGTGLGLSVAHGTVTAHNGAILCDSELGVGTTFLVYFPLFAP